MQPLPLRRGLAVGAAATSLLLACTPSRPAPASQPVAAAARPTGVADARPAASIGLVAQPRADGPRVEIKDFAFAPATLAVPIGATVTWTNRDSEAHTLSTTDRAIASPALDTDDRFAFTLTAAGSYAYHCTLHPFMTATVVVR